MPGSRRVAQRVFAGKPEDRPPGSVSSLRPGGTTGGAALLTSPYTPIYTPMQMGARFEYRRYSDGRQTCAQAMTASLRAYSSYSADYEAVGPLEFAGIKKSQALEKDLRRGRRNILHECPAAGRSGRCW